jgi:hypothetical protein
MGTLSRIRQTVLLEAPETGRAFWWPTPDRAPMIAGRVHVESTYRTAWERQTSWLSAGASSTHWTGVVRPRYTYDHSTNHIPVYQAVSYGISNR